MSEFARIAAGIYLIYLRKSRADNPEETIEEVLAKHETMLQEYAERELGYRIPEDCIYREVVSGESIDDRIEIKKVLSRIEDPQVKGVLVVDPQRLSRGDLEDCGKLINALRYTNTLVVTPMMTYDMENKMERRFFQDELLRGRDYLEYVKEVLFRGRIASAKRGCFINATPPYGYNRVKIGKDWTLEPNENADVVRMIYSWYTKDWMTPREIADELNKMKIPSLVIGTWQRDTVRSILRNHHYDGKIMYRRTKETTVVEDGERIVKRLLQDEKDMVIVEGKHPAIVDHETFLLAQERNANNPKVKKDRKLRNPFAGILKCGHCGKPIYYEIKRGRHSYGCRKAGCCKSISVATLTDVIIKSLEQSELPNLEARLNNNAGDSSEIQKRILQQLEMQMEEYREQEETQYELLETKKYTEELFDKRNAVLREKMQKCQEQMAEVKKRIPESVDLAEKVVTLKDAIASLKDSESTAKQQNRLLKEIVDRIVYASDPSQRPGENNFTLDITLIV